MTIGIESLRPELRRGTGAEGAPPAGARTTRRSPRSEIDGDFRSQIELWEDLLTLIVDPESPRVDDRARKRELLGFLLQRSGLDEQAFWKLPRGKRGREFLARYSRVSRDVPQLEITAFDLDKVLKERFRTEPLTLGAAWHYGFWRSYFSHAAITHPANDGLREEFSTAWDIVRKQPAVLFRTADGSTQATLESVRLDLPMIVGPLPWSDGLRMEVAYLEAIASANEEADLHTRTCVVIEADRFVAQAGALRAHGAAIIPRLEARHADALERGAADSSLTELIAAAGIAEIAWQDGLERAVQTLRRINPRLWISIWIRRGDFAGEPAFLAAIESAVKLEGVAMIHYHSGAEKSYRLTPRIDAFLKARFLRARVQLVSAGGDTDTQASAATVYEAVLLGANGGAMTHVASVALLPELIDVLQGAPPEPVVALLAGREPEKLRDLALDTLTCWQHSILDFLSCMGIDDIQKTSGNTMAITVTEDWVREVDALATPEFGSMNAGLNQTRVTAEPVPAAVREVFKPSALLRELRPDLPLVLAGKVMEYRDANFHLENTNRNLNGDFLEVIYRMAAGRMPGADDFFIESDMGEFSLDQIGLKLSRASLEWSLARLKRDPRLLDYVSLAVPRGFLRPGAVPPGSRVSIARVVHSEALVDLVADTRGGFEVRLEPGHAIERFLDGDQSLWLRAIHPELGERVTELPARDHGGHGLSVARASRDGAVTIRRSPQGGVTIAGFGFREPVWHGPVNHSSISLGAASEDFLMARVEGNAGLSMTSSGEGGPLRLQSDEDMKWESLQAASGHFGIHAADLRRVRDVEIKINQGAKPGKGGRLSGAKVTPTVARARNIPVGTDALSPDPKHDIYSIEDMPAEVWLWLLYHNHCGIKITGSNYTRYVAAGMWSNFVVDYLLIDSGLGGSGNYHADSSHVGWPDIFRTILHTHHALVMEKVALDPRARNAELRPIRDLNGAAFGAGGGTRLFASGGLRGEVDMLKVLIAGADAIMEASIGKAVAFGCNQCGNCHLDCPRGGITTKPELTLQNDRALMRQRFRNWTVLNLIKLAVLIDALNHEHGALDAEGGVADAGRLIDDIRKLRGRTDLLVMPRHDPSPAVTNDPAGQSVKSAEHDSCRVGSLAVSEPVTVHAIWESACRSFNGGNNRGGGIDFAGFTPAPLRDKTCLIFNTIGPDREDTMREMLMHLTGCRFFDAAGGTLSLVDVQDRLSDFRLPVREKYAWDDGWRDADLRENPGDFHTFFVELEPIVLRRYGRTLLESPHWLQRATKYSDLPEKALLAALDDLDRALGATPYPAARERLIAFVDDVREEYFTALAHLFDSRYYRTHRPENAPAGKYAEKRRGFVVSMGEDLGAIKISGWTHTIPEYFDFDRFWSHYPGAAEQGGVEVTVKGRTFRTTALYAHAWGMHHRYPTNSPAIDAEGRGNPAGAHPFKAYNLLLMHNGEQVGVDSTSPFLGEFGYVHADSSMGVGATAYDGDSVYERKALTDTEYAAYLVDFTRRVLGLTTEEASQIISPITGFDLEEIEPIRRAKLRLLMTNYVQLTPTGPYKFTIVESRRVPGERTKRRVVGFRENMDIKFLRPHEIVVSRDRAIDGDAGDGGAHVQAVANGSEAKIADTMLRILHQQGVLGDSGADLRFSMRPGGNPGRREYGGVFEAFTEPGSGAIDLRNRFGEEVAVDRAGAKVDLTLPLDRAVAAANPGWTHIVDQRLEQLGRVVEGAGAMSAQRVFGPEDLLPPPANELIENTLECAVDVTFADYRYLVEQALPAFAAGSDPRRAVAIRVLTEVRKRIALTNLGGKALSSMEYLTDGGRAADGTPEGGLYRILDAVPPLYQALKAPKKNVGRYGRLTLDTRDDLAPPVDAARDVLVIDFAGFIGESFKLDSASRIVSEAVRLGWKHVVGYDFIGGPRYVGTNLAGPSGAAAEGVTIELYGREFGDFAGALLEGASIWIYGQGQSHVGLKADSGYVFVLQDILNTGMYAAHGGTISIWESGSRFAAAGQNKVLLGDGKTPAPGFKSIHFGSPNEYAFEYLMSGGENSLHVVMGFRKPNARGELALKARPYSGKFFMSGAAAGRVFVFDPEVRMQHAQYRGNVLSAVTVDEWQRDLAPLVERESRRRGLPLRIEGEFITVRLEGQWRRWRFDEAFAKLVPVKVMKASQEKGVVPPALKQLVGE
ncbi:MAG TPA: glutamate synthase-related protein [Candidatus Udaeobacter sp.]|nr:glutamate synthase-related protein [Candidatus Udaeobacter sp.]